MITFDNMVEATFLRRENRFIALVELASDQSVVKAHLANTGRMRELLVTGRRCYLLPASNPARKTKWDLFLIEQNDSLVCLRAVFANNLVASWLDEGVLPFCNGLISYKMEQRIGEHRFDFLLHYQNWDCVMEVKSVNYISDGLARFPDAPTSRGAAHVKTLVALANQGVHTALVFVTMGQPVETLVFNRPHDPIFADAMLEAKKAGVETLVCESGFTSKTAILRGFRTIDWRRSS